MNDRKWTIVYSSPSMPPEYLSAIETFRFGTDIVPHFHCHPSLAFPLTREDAEKVLNLIRRNLTRNDITQKLREKIENDPTLGWDLEAKGITLIHPPKLQIIPVPWSKADNYPFEEVSDND